jgi:RNA recognition motif-containing protein
MSSSVPLKCQILVRNLSKRTTAKQLQQYASRYGSVMDCYLTETDGEAFIEYHDRTSVDVFMDKRPHSVDGNTLQCQRRLAAFELQKPVKRLFLRGTIQQLSETRLANYFDKYGKVISCTIPKGKRNNTFTHFGYAFVAFDDDDIVDRIIQDKPHFIDDMELEIQKAEDLSRTRARSTSRSPSSRSSRSSINANHVKRHRRESLSPMPMSMKRMRPVDDLTLRQLEEDNRRLREHAMMMKTHFDEDIWKLRRELDDGRRRYDQLKLEFDHLRRDYARITSELQQKSSTRHFNSNNKRDPSSRH